LITITASGSFKNTDKFLKAMSHLDIRSILEESGREGVAALALATPIRTGRTATSWSYEVTHKSSLWEIVWSNGDVENGFPVAIMLQYGHGTGTGGYVQGTDYINPAIQPIFDNIAVKVWRAVTSA